MKKFTRTHYLLVAAAALVTFALAVAIITTKPQTKPTPAPARTATIVVEDNQFTPATLTIKRGTRVTWRISGDDEDTYQIVTNPAPFDQPAGFGSPEFHGDGTYTYVFTKTGNYGYHNRLLPTGGGEVRVMP
jgi:plastocyanin